MHNATTHVVNAQLDPLLPNAPSAQPPSSEPLQVVNVYAMLATTMMELIIYAPPVITNALLVRPVPLIATLVETIEVQRQPAYVLISSTMMDSVDHVLLATIHARLAQWALLALAAKPLNSESHPVSLFSVAACPDTSIVAHPHKPVQPVTQDA